MRLSLVCIENVQDLDRAHFQKVGNQGAMTAPPDRFCAHDRSGYGAGSKIEKALNTFAELLCLHVIGITTK